MRNHEFIPINEFWQYCKLCDQYYSNSIIIPIIFKCEEEEKIRNMVKICSITHKWEFCETNYNTVINNLDVNYKCKVCEIFGYKFDFCDGIYVWNSKIYTCNEYLMIRANE